MGRCRYPLGNAGVQHIEPLRDLALKDWQRTLAVHLDGAFLTTRAAMRSMEAAGRGGNIIYTGSFIASPPPGSRRLALRPNMDWWAYVNL